MINEQETSVTTCSVREKSSLLFICLYECDFLTFIGDFSVNAKKLQLTTITSGEAGVNRSILQWTRMKNKSIIITKLTNIIPVQE